jgi:hypothetical protein
MKIPYPLLPTRSYPLSVTTACMLHDCIWAGHSHPDPHVPGGAGACGLAEAPRVSEHRRPAPAIRLRAVQGPANTTPPLSPSLGPNSLTPKGQFLAFGLCVWLGQLPLPTLPALPTTTSLTPGQLKVEGTVVRQWNLAVLHQTPPPAVYSLLVFCSCMSCTATGTWNGAPSAARSTCGTTRPATARRGCTTTARAACASRTGAGRSCTLLLARSLPYTVALPMLRVPSLLPSLHTSGCHASPPLGPPPCEMSSSAQAQLPWSHHQGLLRVTSCVLLPFFPGKTPL